MTVTELSLTFVLKLVCPRDERSREDFTGHCKSVLKQGTVQATVTDQLIDNHDIDSQCLPGSREQGRCPPVWHIARGMPVRLHRKEGAFDAAFTGLGRLV